MLAFSALFYMLRAPNPGAVRNLVLAVIAVLGVFANFVFLAAIRSWIRRAFQQMIGRIRERLSRDYAKLDDRDVVARLELYLRSAELNEVPKYPIGGGPLRTASIIAAVAATAKFLSDLYALLVL
jgi:hypothetical protein